MTSPVLTLAGDGRFIPFVYDYCDMRCGSCPVTSRCLLHAVDARRRLEGGSCGGGATAEIEHGIQLARAVVAAAAPHVPAIAVLDVRLANPATAPRVGHPLEWLARHYATETSRFLTSLSARLAPGLTGATDAAPAPGFLTAPAGNETTESLAEAAAALSWFHILIAAKIYRACVSHRHSRSIPALADDANGCAKVALLGIDRSVEALRQLALSVEDVRIDGLLELLAALEVGVDLKFPEARTFLRPGLDGPGSGIPH